MDVFLVRLDKNYDFKRLALEWKKISVLKLASLFSVSVLEKLCFENLSF